MASEKMISADTLLLSVRDDPDINGKNFARFKNHIEDAPTVDAVEVVRCKDCKYYTHANQSKHWNEKELACFRKARITVKPDDFCSYGEKRGDNEVFQ